jgi:aerobic carbon-monoxide dehydrogenase large subunit
MDPSGFVEARIGASPHGQGLKTSLSQLIADEVGIDPSDITVVYGDTDRTPYGWGTFASRSMVIAGGAAKLGSEELRRRLSKIASDVLEVAEEDLALANGVATVKGTALSVPISDLARTAYHRSHRLQPDAEPGLRVKATYNPHGTFSNACHVAMVEVDPETGAVNVQNFLVVEDAGVLINPMIVDGQVHGGVAQGIASALYEELVYDSQGTLLTTSLMDYLPPTMTEIPHIEIEHIVTRSDATITGAKGLGEGGTIGAPAAVLNAITDALSPFGVQVNETPATPERIRKLIRSAQEGS